MTLGPIRGAGTPAFSVPKVSFKPPTGGPQRVSVPREVKHVGTPVPTTSTANRVMNQVQSAQARMDQVLKLAESGKTFSAAELLSLQTHVYRASQELDLAGKVVEKATGGVKQVLQTQV